MKTGGCWRVSQKAHGVVKTLHLLSAAPSCNSCHLPPIRQCSSIDISNVSLSSWRSQRYTRQHYTMNLTPVQSRHAGFHLPSMVPELGGVIRLHNRKCTNRIGPSALLHGDSIAESPEAAADISNHEDQQPIEQQKQQHEWPHVPVLLSEVVAAFEGVNLRTFVDGTVGAAGHTTTILAAHPELQTLVAIDQDPTALELARCRINSFLDGSQAAGSPYSSSTRQKDPESTARDDLAATSTGSSSNATIATLPDASLRGRGEGGGEGRGGGEEQEGEGEWSGEAAEGRMRVASQLITAGRHDGEEGRRESPGVRLVRGNFRQLGALCESVGVREGSVDGILLDIGVSSMQIDDADRGFSFIRDGPLDMRMDPEAPLSASDVINDWPESEIGRILRDYGEERQWRQLARRVVGERGKGYRIETTGQLARILEAGRFKPKRPGAIHPATRSFQALRIAVNDELTTLSKAIPLALQLLAPNGRLAVISFHSLEDRIVKRAFLDAAAGVGSSWGQYKKGDTGDNGGGSGTNAFRIITRRPIVASEEEMRRNSRSRSAKLRVIERL